MAFDLGSLLKDVSDSDTGREQIEYIALDLIDGDAGNFYALSDINQLANNIATVGLQQPLRVRKHPTEAGRYMVVSGHRRRAALEVLRKDDPEKWAEAACIVQLDSVSPALQQLRLIFANSDTRKMSSADLNEQTAQVEKLLYQLKEEGHEFPGRMRDHVAEVVKISNTKIATLKMIREHLADCWKPDYKKGILGESSAYELSRMAPELQILLFEEKKRTNANIRWLYADDVKTFAKRAASIAKISCKSFGGACENKNAKLRKTAVSERYGCYYCDKCCNTCYHLTSCKNVCPRLKEKVKQMKADAREASRQAKLAQEEKDRPTIEKLQDLWMRFGYAREKAGKSAKEVYEAANMYYAKGDDVKMEELERCTVKFSTETTLPYGYGYRLSDVKGLIAVADLFGCSIDYLLCRTDIPEVASAAPAPAAPVSESDTIWHPISEEPPTGINLVWLDAHGYSDTAEYFGGGLISSVSTIPYEEARWWARLPMEDGNG